MTYIGDLSKKELLRAMWSAGSFPPYYEGSRAYIKEFEDHVIASGFIHVFCGKSIGADLSGQYTNGVDFSLYNRSPGLFQRVVEDVRRKIVHA